MELKEYMPQDNFKYIKDVKSYLVYDNDKVKNPYITIVIPTYKRYDVIGEAIESAVNQMPVDFEWDIIVVDNEAFDGEENETTRIIKSFNCDRIRHYRHSKTTTMYDNHNLGFKLARGEWVMLLHNDDILINNTLYRMGQAIKYLSQMKGKSLGAISAKYHQYNYDLLNPNAHKTLVQELKNYYSNEPMSWRFKLITQNNILFESLSGGCAPTNGTVINREKLIKFGGFKRDAIEADHIFIYNFSKDYAVYLTPQPYGLYRMGGGNTSTSVNTDSSSIISACKLFESLRQFAFSKNIFNKIYGKLFGDVLRYKFANLIFGDILEKYFDGSKEYEFYTGININKIKYKLWNKIILKYYEKIKHHEATCLTRKIINIKNNES